MEEIENTMSNTELREWNDYYNLNLFPSDRQELQLAQLLAVVINYMGGKSKVDDFLVRVKSESNSLDNITAEDIQKAVKGSVDG